MDIDNTELEGIDNFYSNESIEKITDAFSEPFEDENISESMFKAAPDMFDDSTFGGFNRTVVGGAVDALDLGMRTIESGVKGSATAINEAKNYVTGQKDDRLKRDMLAFFESMGTGGATSGPMKLRQGINQLIKSGKTDEAAKVILAESDAFKGNNFKEVLAMTAKREPSPARKMTDAEKKTQEFNFEKNFNLEDSKLRGTMAKRMQENEERIKAVTSNIEKTGYYDAFPRGSKFVSPSSGKEYTVIGYRASSVGVKGKKTLTNLHSKRTELIKSGELPKERKYFDGMDPKISANKDIYDDRFYQPKIIVKDKDGKIELFNYDFLLHQDERKKELLNKVMPTFNAPKVNILDSTKEALPLDIGASKYALDGNLKSNYTTETIKLFDDKLKNIKTAGSSDANKLIGVGIKDGTKVGIRKNLNSRTIDGEKGVLQTIHTNNYNGKALSYQPYATVENVTFNVNQKHRQRIASKAKGLAVPEASGKFNMASVDGTYVSNRNLLKEGYDTEISFNPASGHLYTDIATGQAVKSADTATVIGNRVFANGVTYWKKVDAPKPLDASDGTKLIGEVRYKFKRGGLMARA
tara:strand:+ start:2326 stop:4071 length:1746 start_codon:yes stop_codon:yes gene_type:complete